MVMRMLGETFPTGQCLRAPIAMRMLGETFPPLLWGDRGG